MITYSSTIIKSWYNKKVLSSTFSVFSQEDFKDKHLFSSLYSKIKSLSCTISNINQLFCSLLSNAFFSSVSATACVSDISKSFPKVRLRISFKVRYTSKSRSRVCLISTATIESIPSSTRDVVCLILFMSFISYHTK